MAKKEAKPTETIKTLEKGIENIVEQIEKTPKSENKKKPVQPIIKVEAKDKVSEKAKNELGITADKDDFSDWFTQLMIKAELADYTEVSGCMVFRPNAYAIWEKVVSETDKRFKKLGV